MTTTLPAVVAAAGLSSRMGASKSLLDAGGRTFMSRVIQVLREGGADPVLVVVRDLKGEEAAETRASGARVILNPDPSPGPISSLQAGIHELPREAPGTLFTPVDHPLFRSLTVRLLISSFLNARPSLAAPSHAGRAGHPVVFSRTLFPELLGEDLPRGARTVVHRYLEERLLVPVDDPGILADIDTPADYRLHFPLE